MKINVVLDSHVGELYLINPMLYRWYVSGELDSQTQINIFSLTRKHSKDSVEKELFWAKGIGALKFVGFDVVNGNVGTLAKIIKAFWYLKFLIMIWFNRSAKLNFLPYDQKRHFYSILRKILKGKRFAIPHTTGPEIYKESVLVDSAHQRFSKDLPVLAQNSLSNAYFRMMGYEKQVVVGAYHESKNFQEALSSNLSGLPAKTKKEVVIFSLGLNDKMFTYEEWLESHKVIFEVLSEFDELDVLIKLHPSQSSQQFVSNFPDSVEGCRVVECHPEVVSSRSDFFITIMTSAGHHAISKNKPVANFGLPSLRSSVSAFGNDPYPYQQFSIPELTSKNEIRSWLSECVSGGYQYSEAQGALQKTELCSLEDLIKQYDLCG